MHVTFFAVEKDREDKLAASFCEGVKRSRTDTCEVVRPASYPAPNPRTDVAVMIGVKGYSRRLLDNHLEAGKHTVYIDKGYLGGRSAYFRMSVNSFQPLAYFQKTPRPDDRLRALSVNMLPMRTQGSHIIIAGGSLKYAKWHGLHTGQSVDPMTEWARKSLKRVGKYTNRPLIYRPKPSWKEAVSLSGARFSRPPELLAHLLPDAWALVTFGSNAAVEALTAGVPVIVTGDGIARPLARTQEENIDDLFIPSDAVRRQWLADMAYCQFNVQEMESGLAWKILREQIACR